MLALPLSTEQVIIEWQEWLLIIGRSKNTQMHLPKRLRGIASCCKSVNQSNETMPSQA